MDRNYMIDLATSGLRMPLTVDLVLHEHADHSAIVLDGERLGKVFEDNALRLHSPLAIPRMDLELEKLQLLEFLGIKAEEPGKFHFEKPPSRETIDRLESVNGRALHPRVQAQVDAIAYIARQTSLTPIGMSIGPFSLMTKLVHDPITPVFMAGAGTSPKEDDAVLTVENTLELSIRIIRHLIRKQLDAGARAILLAEPAANTSFFSPRQMGRGANVFDRYVVAYNLQIKRLLDEYAACLFFHCCGEVTETMVRKFTELRPVMLSLGSSRTLWKDARIVPEDIVLYGNLPSKRFYSAALCPVEEVQRMAAELLLEMAETGHPFILGSECDVLSVPGHEAAIREKVAAMTGARSWS